MKRTIKTGPKRLRWRRRDWSGVGGYGQVRRWGNTVGNFRRERLAKIEKARLDDEFLSGAGRGRDTRPPASDARCSGSSKSLAGED